MVKLRTCVTKSSRNARVAMFCAVTLVEGTSHVLGPSHLGQRWNAPSQKSCTSHWWFDVAILTSTTNCIKVHSERGVQAIVDEVWSAFDLVEDDAVEASTELFRQSSSESEDASSIADDMYEESNEEEHKADDVAIEALPPERALELTHTTFVAVVLRVVPPFEVTTGWKTRTVSSQLDTGASWADCRTYSSDKYNCKPSLRQ